MRFDIITIFPEMFASILSGGILAKAVRKGLIEVDVHNLRDFTTDKHRSVDDRPFGGEEGMVFKPEPVFAAVERVRQSPDAPVYLLSPQGRPFDSRLAEKIAAETQVVLVCGRYEGVDERVAESLATDEISIGDYVLTGGEIPAMVIVDAVARHIPGVVGKEGSVRKESFASGGLDYPVYTRPREFRGMAVPEVLFSGDHKNIEVWRRRRALEKTWRRRPDLLARLALSDEDRRLLEDIRKERNEP
ncbi:MAG: tRNA (guanosine(37)-N1)-methyltransferase TrmD [Candidatus Aminicenantes bacterium]|nr:tRNA (guanosine(37)-N1)-methyltransferase TrmD [Candidatus Aminicenantes bacterium]